MTTEQERRGVIDETKNPPCPTCNIEMQYESTGAEVAARGLPTIVGYFFCVEDGCDGPYTRSAE